MLGTADIFPSAKFYVRDLSEPEVEVWSQERSDGSMVTCTSVPSTPHLTKPRPDMLRKATVSSFIKFADGSGSASTGLLGDLLRRGDAKL